MMTATSVGSLSSRGNSPTSPSSSAYYSYNAAYDDDDDSDAEEQQGAQRSVAEEMRDQNRELARQLMQLQSIAIFAKSDPSIAKDMLATMVVSTEPTTGGYSQGADDAVGGVDGVEGGANSPSSSRQVVKQSGTGRVGERRRAQPLLDATAVSQAAGTMLSPQRTEEGMVHDLKPRRFLEETVVVGSPSPQKAKGVRLAPIHGNTTATAGTSPPPRAVSQVDNDGIDNDGGSSSGGDLLSTFASAQLRTRQEEEVQLSKKKKAATNGRYPSAAIAAATKLFDVDESVKTSVHGLHAATRQVRADLKWLRGECQRLEMYVARSEPASLFKSFESNVYRAKLEERSRTYHLELDVAEEKLIDVMAQKEAAKDRIATLEAKVGALRQHLDANGIAPETSSFLSKQEMLMGPTQLERLVKERTLQVRDMHHAFLRSRGERERKLSRAVARIATLERELESKQHHAKSMFRKFQQMQFDAVNAQHDAEEAQLEEERRRKADEAQAEAEAKKNKHRRKKSNTTTTLSAPTATATDKDNTPLPEDKTEDKGGENGADPPPEGGQREGNTTAAADEEIEEHYRQQTADKPPSATGSRHSTPPPAPPAGVGEEQKPTEDATGSKKEKKDDSSATKRATQRRSRRRSPSPTAQQQSPAVSPRSKKTKPKKKVTIPISSTEDSEHVFSISLMEEAEHERRSRFNSERKWHEERAARDERDVALLFGTEEKARAVLAGMSKAMKKILRSDFDVGALNVVEAALLKEEADRAAAAEAEKAARIRHKAERRALLSEEEGPRAVIVKEEDDDYEELLVDFLEADAVFAEQIAEWRKEQQADAAAFAEKAYASLQSTVVEEEAKVAEATVFGTRRKELDDKLAHCVKKNEAHREHQAVAREALLDKAIAGCKKIADDEEKAFHGGGSAIGAKRKDLEERRAKWQKKRDAWEGQRAERRAAVEDAEERGRQDVASYEHAIRTELGGQLLSCAVDQ